MHYAMKYHLPISFRLYKEGNTHDLYGYCVYIHPDTKELRIQRKIVPLNIFSLMKLSM
ncbi:YolD-like family protein [Peribacillus simplex]|uniref:YolD-like family protein n=1 Tax=Peribacillus simplex TaxID=1478 RepID=UPI0037CBD120